MRKVAFVALASVLACSAVTQAAVLYWDGTTSGAVVSQGVADGAGTWTAWSAFPDGWSASSVISSVRYNTAPYTRTKSAYNTTSGQAAYAEIEFALTGAGYWEIAATVPATSLGVGNVSVTALSGWQGLPASTSMFSTGNTWNVMGTYLSTSSAAKIRFDENSQTTNRWYMDQIRLTSATPGAATNAGPADGATNIPVTGDGNELAWSAGSCSSFFDVFLSTDSNPTDKVGSDLTGTSFDPDSLSLAANTTYYWKVVAKNVDMETAGTVWSFTTTPEPATLGFLALGSLMFLRRRYA